MDHGSHSDHDMGHMAHEHMSMIAPNNGTVDESYYFAYPSHKSWLYLHILFMFFGWVVVLPLCKLSSPNPKSLLPGFDSGSGVLFEIDTDGQ